MDINRIIEENERKRNRLLINQCDEIESFIRKLRDLQDDVNDRDIDPDKLKEKFEKVVSSGVYKVFIPSSIATPERKLQEFRTVNDMMTEIINTAYRIGFKKGME